MGPRRSSGGGDDICFTADKPHFFKIVVEEKLMLPEKFVMKHGSAMGNRIFLRLANGKVWEMELSKQGRNAWFEKGWMRFVEHYSLSKGDLLLFQYQGCKEFTVMMIRASWSNIHCSRKTHIHNKVPIHGGDDGYAEVLAGLNGGRRDKRKSALPCPDFHEKNFDDEDDDVPFEVSYDFNSSKKMRPNSSNETTSAPLSDFRLSGKFHLGETSRRVAQEFGGNYTFARSKKDKFVKGNKGSKIKRIGVSESGNHYFSVVLQPSYVRKGATVAIPIKFDCKQKNMILKVADKSWDVIIAKYELSSSHITRGWSKFAMENSLKVGDCCVFELLKTQANVLKVSICRKAKRGKPSLSRSSFREKNIGDKERTDDDDVSVEVTNKSKGNSDSSIENTSYFRQNGKFHLGQTSGTSACGRGKKGGRSEMTNRPLACSDFREKNLDDEERTDDDDDDVLLEVLHDFNSSKKMIPNSSKDNTSAPLSDFRLSGKFRLGETSRDVAQEFGGNSAFARSEKDKFAQRNKGSEIKRIGVSESGNHYFSVVLRPSYVRKSATLAIPFKFDCKQNNMILKVADKSWDVIIAKYETRSSHITRGWSKFAMENSLKVGDCCVFELLKTRPNVLKVSICRKAKRGKPSLSRPSFREKNIGDISVEALDDFNVSYKSKRSLNSSIETTLHFRQTGKFHLGETSGHIAEEVDGTSACGRGKKGGRIEITNRPLAFEKVGVLESGNPYFNVILHPSHVPNRKRPKLVVPKKFAVDHIKCPMNMMLKVEDKSWPVLIVTHGESSTMRLGWSQFARENGLQVGDSCVFELLKAESNVLRVLIGRRHAG